MTELSRAIAVKPIITYPREAQVGKTYLMTIDLQPEEKFEWQYEEEEYPIYCSVDSEIFSSKPVGEPVVVLHRFGGSYGEARFLLTSAVKPEKGRIRISLINSYGVPFKVLNLEDILLRQEVFQHSEVIQDLKVSEKIDIRAAFPEQWATLKNDLASRDGTSFQQVIQRVEMVLTGESNSILLQESLRFFIDLLQVVVDSQGDVSQIYSVLARNQEKLNEALSQVMSIGEPYWFNTNINQAMLTADVFVAFGNLIAQFPLGSRSINLELAINAYQLALKIKTRESFPADWAIIQNNLAIAYSNRIRGDQIENIERAIDCYQQALTVRMQSATPVEWAQSMMNLATAYRSRIQGNRADNIEQAIAAYQQALTVMTQTAMPVEWAITMTNLATAYRSRIQGNQADNIEQAIAAYQQALAVMTQTAMPVEWAMIMTSLATAYRNRIRGDRAENIEQAITAYQQALTVRMQATMPVEWAETMTNLATAYRNRIRGDRAENIEQAIASYELALQVYSRNAFPANWAMIQNNLATAYHDRIRGDRAENIEQAIAAYQQALTVMTQTDMPFEWAEIMTNLATAYRNRIRGDRAENIEQAIAVYQQALTVRTQVAIPVDWAETMMNLATAYRKRIRGERAENIEQAIAAYELALQIYTYNAFPEQWAATQNDLATAYRDRIRGERADNLERAIQACELALKVYTRDAFPVDWAMIQNNLATGYGNRILGDRSKNLEQAIYGYGLALQVYTHDAFPKECQQTSRNLGDLHFEIQNWDAASGAYRNALAAAETLYQSCILLDGKAAELAELANLLRRTTYVLARTGNLSQAVETLEQGRARGLSESLNRYRADLTQLRQLHPDLYSEYETLTTQLRNLENQQRDLMASEARHNLTSESMREIAVSLHQQLNTLLQEIRQVPGYKFSLTSPTFEAVRRVIRVNQPLIYLVSTSVGSLSLIVTDNNIESVWLDTLNESQLNNLLYQAWFSAYPGNAYQDSLMNEIQVNQSSSGSEEFVNTLLEAETPHSQIQTQNDHQKWFSAIDSVTRQLWEPLMQPVVSHLRSQNYNQAILISTGVLSFFPLHAAWTEDLTTPTGRYYALDAIHFTYSPNALSLQFAHEIAERTPADSILAIDNPRNDLPNSVQEIQAAITTFPVNTILRHESATCTAVLQSLPNHNVVHFSGHGTANLNTPLSSGLVMSDGLLTLRNILSINLAEQGIRLAVLSACETGLPGIQLPDEVVSLPAGLMQAGVAGIIASLWSPSDLSTMLLFTKFYELWRNNNLPPRQAFRQAQIWLRDSTEAEIAPLSGVLTRNPNNRPFSHPFYWAAFSYTGV
ncbi:hypothetical protein BST81_16585 [Leptolyngbya sp. 'hensonii']|uniref:CHAT domain-containing protein n=1 Tax=Leptolyngbya sp. 'hensonii' TaxID=1922337 RepID=UPI00094F810E|nr:CHAT domain-containing tetratricopeptide repeat protein [Leptolyngbya sp. 'hensonii']OLP17409.1 hypothetical protein BST81_16585 [Leptolyngbya sp. 'hensonii']